MKNQLLIRIDRRLTQLKDFAAARFVLYLTIALGTTLVFPPARGAYMTLPESIAADDGGQLFYLTVASAEPVDPPSHGYAGETASTGPEPQPIAFEAPGQFVLAAFSRKGKG